MESDDVPSSTSFAKCCDCECTCSMMNRSFSGTWLRSVKRKFGEFDEDNKPYNIPGFVLSNNARIEVENECVALREMVSSQQQTIEELSVELEEERNAASSAANEAMSMILRLQGEKADIQMEFRQFKRFTEEKMAHDQQEIVALEDLLYKREQAIQSLTCEVQMYKHRMMSYGLTGAEADGDGERERGLFSRNNSAVIEGQFEAPIFYYPPLKVNLNEMQGYSEVDNEAAGVEKYASQETPRSRDHFRDLEHRINQLERTPKYHQHEGEFGRNNVLEKVIADQSPRHPRHLRKSSTDNPISFTTTDKEANPDIPADSPKSNGSPKKAAYAQKEDFPNLRKMDNGSEDGDDTSDRVYTIDSVHQGAPYNSMTEPKTSVQMDDDYTNIPRESLSHTEVGDTEIKKLYSRLHALEADRESMRQAMISMRTDKAQLILLKEIAQQLCKEMSPVQRTTMTKSSIVGNFSFLSVFKWIISFVFWRKKARRCRYMCGTSANNMGLQMVLDKGPRAGPWRCLSRSQV